MNNQPLAAEDPFEKHCRETFDKFLEVKFEGSERKWTRGDQYQTPDYGVEVAGLGLGVEVTSFWLTQELDEHKEPNPLPATKPLLNRILERAAELASAEGILDAHYKVLFGDVRGVFNRQDEIRDTVVEQIRALSGDDAGASSNVENGQFFMTIWKMNAEKSAVSLGGHHLVSCGEETIHPQAWSAIKREIVKKAGKQELVDAGEDMVILLFDGFGVADKAVYESVPGDIGDWCPFSEVSIIYKSECLPVVAKRLGG